MATQLAPMTAIANMEQPPDPPPSSSKRKRTQDVNAYSQTLEVREGQTNGGDNHTPKRARSTKYQSEDRTNTRPSSPEHNVRRKKGRYSLSSLSRRHDSNSQRPSKFQEGSMNDKPSDKPPSLYIRRPFNDAGAPQASMDDLMGDYHEDAEGMRDSIEQSTTPYQFGSRARHEFHPSPATATSVEAKESGIHRFGRMFNPMNVWEVFAKTWRETRDEMTIHNIEENRRKAAQKLLAEQKYAGMKKNGAFGSFTAVREDVAGSASPHDGNNPYDHHAARDSAVIMNDERSLIEDQKPFLAKTPMLQPLQPGDANRSHTPFQEESIDKLLKSRKSLFHIRRPSLTNLKRVRSEYNLGAFSRHSSSSLSPEKQTPAEPSALRPSQSRKDLHKQQKLSKRVSDLENKLQEARRELTAAITNASPLPSLPSRFERYTPNHTLTRPRFLPGALPSLPSERLLFPEQAQQHLLDESPITADEQTTALAQSTQALVEFGPDDDEVSSDDSPSKPGSRGNIEQRRQETEQLINRDQEADMDPASFTEGYGQINRVQDGYADLDSKLKALDASVKSRASNKIGKPRKRKTLKDDDHKSFVPGAGEDSDEDWETTKGVSKRKRKSTGKDKSPRTKKSAKKNPSNAQIAEKKHTEGLPTTTNVTRSVMMTSTTETQTHVENEQPVIGRRSIDSQLEPISEEDTIVVASAVNNHNSLAPPPASARHSRTRSRSPGKWSRVTMRSGQITTLGQDRARSASPPPATGNSKPVEDIDGVFTASPGLNGVPEMPSRPSEMTQKSAKTGQEEYEWPEDVF